MANRKTIVTQRITTGAAERYSANVKCLFVRINGTMIYSGQHERCDKLEQKVLTLAANINKNVDFEIKTGFGVLIERGKVKTNGTLDNQTGVTLKDTPSICTTVQW